MAYLGNGIYDLLDVIRASKNPQINYEGLYQDAPSNIATSNLLQAMQPQYEYRNSNYINNLIDKNAFDLSGNVPVDFNRQVDFKNYLNNQPLRSNYESLARFQNFNPRVGIVNAGLPFASTTSEDEKDYLYSDMEDIVYQTPRTIADQNRILGQTFTPRPKSFRDSETLQEYFQNRNPLTGIMNLFRNLPTPMNILRGGLQGIQSLNQRLRNTDFGQSKTLADYFDARRYGGRDAREAAAARNMAQARGLQKQIDQRPSAIGGGGGGGGRDMGASVSRSAADTRSKDLGSMRGGVGR